jgi:hypothetical protein
MKRKTSIVAALTTILIFSFNVPVCGGSVAEITYIKGVPFVGTNKEGPWQALERGVSVSQGQLIKTGRAGIVEITLPDKSVIRLAPETLYRLDAAVFLKKKYHLLSSRIFFCKMWG